MKRFLLALAGISKGRALVFLSLMLCQMSFAQQQITGNVTDATGEAIIGAKVMEKGAQNGTITDFDGNFTLKVEPGKTLVITYIGFQPQEVAAKNGMKVVMKEDALALNELVVTA